MGKLGKKARKFAKKNLQSVLKRRRKIKSMINKKSRDKQGADEDHVEDTSEVINNRYEDEVVADLSLSTGFSEEDSELDGDASESDGYLSEDLSCSFDLEIANENKLEENSGSALCMQNNTLCLELEKQKKQLDRLKKKDPEFLKFLEMSKDLEKFREDETFSDDGEITQISDHEIHSNGEDNSNLNKSKLITGCSINSSLLVITEQHNISGLTILLNAYRAACHYGAESVDGYKIQNNQTCSRIIMVMLLKADDIFRDILGIAISNRKKEAVLELGNTTKWKSLRPLIKSYFRSTLFLLNQVTDTEILAFSINQLRASVIFFAAFPALLHRLIRISINLWATAGGILSSCSLLILRDVASIYNLDCFDTCLSKSYKAFISHYKSVEPTNLRHMQFLRNSIVELCSLDVQRSINIAMVSIHQLAKIMQQAVRTKNKEVLKKICSWQFINCVDLWVMFISANIRDYDLHSLLYMIVQVLNGMAHLFPGPRYFPLKVKCIQWLNHLSSSSGIFIPVSSMVLDALEYKVDKEYAKSRMALNFLSALKLPKHWLKSRNFQEECVFSVIELLSAHFAQWSYFISFPELATIPLIRLRKFHEKTTIEGLKRAVKRLIDQVEQNVDFVQRKRADVPFSPKDQESVESFLQLEKSSSDAPFTQYYKSILQKSASRHLATAEKFSNKGVNVGRNLEKRKVNQVIDGRREGKKGKKQRA